MIIRSASHNELSALRALWREAFGDDDAFLDLFFTRAFAAERSRCMTDGDELLAALYWFDCEYRGQRVAYIYAVATAAKHRGRGLCRALMEDTHSHLAELGYAGAILVPGEERLFAFYEKSGYRTCACVDEFTEIAGGEKACICEIEKKEYAAFRRRMLPAGGVIQEGENLDFLESQAKFYKGEDLLLAARINDGTLFAVEYLGDREKAPAVLFALGCRCGKYRAPGNGRPFAMYRPLSKNIQTPTYFGLAFD